MPRPAEFWPSSNAPPGMTLALTPTAEYFVMTVFAGSLTPGGAVSMSGVPLGWLTSVHCMSNAHSMVRPATTDLSIATMSTAVQASETLSVTTMQTMAIDARDLTEGVDMAVPGFDAIDR